LSANSDKGIIPRSKYKSHVVVGIFTSAGSKSWLQCTLGGDLATYPLQKTRTSSDIK